MTIRSFREQDTEQVIAIWDCCGLLRPWNDPYKDIARKLSEQPELFLVAEMDNLIVGCGMGGYDGHRGWVYYLGVLPEYRGRGIARRMMEEFEDRLQKRGCPKLQLMVRNDNQDVIDFYTHLGYIDSDCVTLGKRLIPDNPDYEQ